MQTVKFTRQESNWYEYTVQVPDSWDESQDPLEGKITEYKEIDGTNESISGIEDLEIL